MKKLIMAIGLVAAGIATAVALASTGTVSVCATATSPATPGHTVAVDGSPVTTLAGQAAQTASQCATTTYTVPTVTQTTTVVQSPLKFDGRANQMASLSGDTDGSNATSNASQSPNLWTCVCFMNSDIALAADSTYGKDYNVSVATGDNNGFGGTGPTYGAGQLSIRQNNDLGQTDYYSMAVKVPAWSGPIGDLFFVDLASLGYQTSSNDQVAFGLWNGPNDAGPLVYSMSVNGGLSNGGGQGTAVGTTNYQDTVMPVTFGRWDDFVIAVSWSTTNTGEIKIYNRVPGGAWSVVYDKTNISDYLYGPVQGTSGFAQDGSNWPTIIDKIGLYFKEYGGESESVQESGLTVSSDLATAEAQLP